MTLRFIRRLQHRKTKSGNRYVVSIPREVAQDLQLEHGGLLSLEVRRGAEVVLKAYQDEPLMITEFNPSSLDDYHATSLYIATPLEHPVTKGPSKDVVVQGFKPFLAASRLALKLLKMRIDLMMSTPSGRAAMAEALRRRGFR